jgi:prepilin-type N-terminal cleavage/methylation domain-containing protein/prepilin-type processing-associated H-X9-DG protein
MRRGAQRGFTLIELLTVMAIMSILSSMLFPSFAKARCKAEQADCISNLSQLGKAFIMYVSDNDSLMPPHDLNNWQQAQHQFGFVVPNWANTSTSNWAKSIYPYLKSYEVYLCKSTFGCAPGSDDTIPNTSYTMNGCFAATMLDSAPKPSSTIVLYDWTFDFSWASVNPARDPAASGAYRRFVRRGEAPHEEQFDCLFADGHAKRVPGTTLEDDLYYAPVEGLFYF